MQHINGRTIKRLREARGWTQGELAYHAHVDQSLISKLEEGRRSDVRVSTAKRLAQTFQISLDELVAEQTQSAPGQSALPSDAEMDQVIDHELNGLIREVPRLSAHDREVVKDILRPIVARDRQARMEAERQRKEKGDQ